MVHHHHTPSTPMLDAHVHIERGPYTPEWIWRFIKAARQARLDSLYLLEHSSRFYDFWDTYDVVRRHPECGAYQTSWLERKCTRHLADYIHLIERMRNEKLPIEVKFGLEICYFPEHEQTIRQIVLAHPLDFLTGSIHWIDGWGFDHSEQRHTWQGKDIDQVYMARLAASQPRVRQGNLAVYPQKAFRRKKA